MSAYVFDQQQLLNAARQYLDAGPEATRALRQQEIDGALAFLGSEAAKKLRVERKQAAA